MNQNEQLDIGGVYRCCSEQLAIFLHDLKVPAQDGDISVCKHCKASLIRENGVWQRKKD